MITSVVTTLRAALISGFLEAWGGRGVGIERDRLGDALLEQWSRAQAFPNPPSDGAMFAKCLARHVAADAVPADAIAHIWGEDLWLADGCVQGDAQALARFDATVLEPLGALLATIGADLATVEEVRQRLRVHLLAPAGGPPRIAAYSGRARLARWIHVVAVRTLHRLTAERRPALFAADDDVGVGFAEPTADGELEYFKQVYRAEFKDAFAQALRALSRRDRNLLRHAIVDGLSVDEIGRIFGVSRATAARHVAKAKAELVESARATLRGRLRLAPAEMQSVLRILQSQLDLSVRRLLAQA